MSCQEKAGPEERLLAAARELTEQGWSRTQIYDFLREGLPPSGWQERLRQVAIRDIEIFMGLLAGEPLKELRQIHGVNNLTRRAAILQGAKRVRSTLGLGPGTLPEYLAAAETKEGQDAYRELCARALSLLRAERPGK